MDGVALARLGSVTNGDRVQLKMGTDVIVDESNEDLRQAWLGTLGVLDA